MRSSPDTVAAVVFDLDGVLVDTEPLWADAKRELVGEAGGRWTADAPSAMLGMSGPEWSGYMRDELAVPLAATDIHRRVVDAMLDRIAAGVPLIDGAREAVTEIASRWPLALASSADRPVIEAVLRTSGLAPFFRAVVSSEEAGRGKPAPDVYLAAAARLGVSAAAAVAVEDSGNGMRAAKAAGMSLVAIPNPYTAVDGEALALADVVLGSISELTPAAVEDARNQGGP
jgi:HAD superfamily hydrolase (TIGR01509 family)